MCQAHISSQGEMVSQHVGRLQSETCTGRWPHLPVGARCDLEACCCVVLHGMLTVLGSRLCSAPTGAWPSPRDCGRDWLKMDRKDFGSNRGRLVKFSRNSCLKSIGVPACPCRRAGVPAKMAAAKVTSPRGPNVVQIEFQLGSDLDQCWFRFGSNFVQICIRCESDSVHMKFKLGQM